MAILEVNNVKKNIYDTIWRQSGAGVSNINFSVEKRRVCGDHGGIRFRKNNLAEHSGSAG